MDALLEAPEQLETLFNFFTGAGLIFQSFFIYVTLVHTPKEMSTYKFTMMNAVIWSLLIVIHVGLILRPVTFLPLPVCLITGPAKYLGSFWGGHLQVLIGLVLFVNKSTSYVLCLTSHFFAFKFPVFVRRLRLREGVFIFMATHLGITVLLIASAYVSGLFTSPISLTAELLKEEINIYSPQKYRSLQKLIDNSLIIGATRQSLHCFYTIVYLIIIFIEITISLSTMIYALIVLYMSIQHDKSSNSRKFKKRMMTMLTIRTLIPTITFNIPAFFAVYVVQFDRDDTSAFEVQWCLLLILFSPAICCVTTIFGLKPYRRALFGAFKLKFSRHSDSEAERTSEAISKRTSNYTIGNSKVYTTGTLVPNNIDFHNNRI